jgi:hypothetical protein
MRPAFGRTRSHILLKASKAIKGKVSQISVRTAHVFSPLYVLTFKIAKKNYCIRKISS